MALIHLLFSGWFTALATFSLLAGFVYLASVLRRPPLKHISGVPKLAPGWPIFGSVNFYRSRQEFMFSGKQQTPTGQFRFNYGPFNIIAMSGHAARETFYASRPMDLLSAFYKLYAAAPEIEFFGRDLADSFLQTFKKFVQQDYLSLNLPNFISDAHTSLVTTLNPSSTPNPVVIDPFEHVFLLIYQLSHRSLGCNDIADDPVLLKHTMEIVRAIDWTSGMQIMFTGLPTVPKMKKWIAGMRLYRILNKVIEERKRTGRREGDPMQVLMDQGYDNTLVCCFIVAGIFAAVTNTGNQAAWVLCHLAENREWYDRVKNEVDAVIAKERVSQRVGDQAPVADIIQGFSMDTWKSAFPSIDLALRESIRLNMAGVSFRQNVGEENVVIGHSKEVIPPNVYAVYDMDDVHFDEAIYTEPMKWDPGRYLPGREEHKKIAHGYLGWGSGLHPCPGQRFAELEVVITTVMLIAHYDFELCTKKGAQWAGPLPRVDHGNFLGTKRPKEEVFLKCNPRFMTKV